MAFSTTRNRSRTDRTDRPAADQTDQPSGESMITGNQTVNGTAQDDILAGGTGDDRIRAQRGDDFLIATAGNDQLIGGGGYDTVFFTGDRSDYVIEKAGRKILVTHNGETDVLTSIEELRFGASPGSSIFESFRVSDGGFYDTPSAPQSPAGGSSANQRINGTREDDRLAGGDGNDRINARGGDDLLIDGAGNDTMNGGSGNDAVFFAGSVSDYTFEFTGRKVLVSNGVETDTLTNIEQVLFGANPDDADIATFLITNAELIALVPAPPEPAPPEPAPPGPTPPQSPSGLDAFEAEVLSLVNEFRAQNGLPALQADSRLSAAAEDWSQTMANDDFFAHSTPAQVEEQDYDWRAWGENIAAGQQTPESVVNAWIDSPGHRANMLSENYQDIGVGYYYLEDDTGSVNYHHYWTQVFATEAGDMIV